MTTKSQTKEKNLLFLRCQLQIFYASFLYPKTPVYQFAAENQPFSNLFLRLKFGPFSLTKLFLQNCIFMKHYFFTFSAISNELSKLQSSTIWQKKRLYLTNMIYFMIHDKKMMENRLNRAIYQSQICLFTLYQRHKF